MWNWCRNNVCCCCYHPTQSLSEDRQPLMTLCSRCHLIHSSSSPCKIQVLTPRSEDYLTARPISRSGNYRVAHSSDRQDQKAKKWLESKYCCSAQLPNKLPAELRGKVFDSRDTSTSSKSHSEPHINKKQLSFKMHIHPARKNGSLDHSGGDGDYMPITVSAPDLVNSGAAYCRKSTDPISAKGDARLKQCLRAKPVEDGKFNDKEKQPVLNKMHDFADKIPSPDFANRKIPSPDFADRKIPSPDFEDRKIPSPDFANRKIPSPDFADRTIQSPEVSWRPPQTMPSPDWKELPFGKVKFNASYYLNTKRLFVHIISAEDLPPKGCYKYNVILKLNILKDKEQFSQVVGPDLNPRFNEDFNFTVNAINHKVLKITAYDADLRGKYNAVGQTLFYLENMHGFKLDHTYTACLYRRAQLDLCPGHIQLTLQYDNKRKYMTIKVHGARQLCVQPEVFSSGREEYNTYAKLSFYCGDSELDSQRTGTVQNSRNPVYNCTFEFDMKTEYPWENFVVTTVWLKAINQRDIPIGKLILGPFCVASEDKKTSWGLAVKGLQTVTYWYMMDS